MSFEIIYCQKFGSENLEEFKFNHIHFYKKKLIEEAEQEAEEEAL